MKKIFLILLTASVAAGASDDLVFHFDFKDAAGKRSITDKTGKFTAKVASGCFATQSGALRTSIGADITVKDTRPAKPVEQMTVTAWILKKSTPDNTPILAKGELPYQTQFDFGVIWRTPYFRYKNKPKQPDWKGLWIVGDFGSQTGYPQKDWLKPGAPLIESSGYWWHVAAVFDKGTTRIYLNGRLTSERAEPGQILAGSSLPFRIGSVRRTGENTNAYTADILLNDLRLYSRALNAEEIGRLMQSETAKYPKGCLIPRGKTHLNALPPCWSYLDPIYDPAMKKDLPVTLAFEKNRREYRDFSSGIRAEKKTINGIPALFLNGERFPLLQGIANLADREHNLHIDRYSKGIRNFAAAGIDLNGCSVAPGRFWKGEGVYDWTVLDATLKAGIKANPNAAFMMYISLTPPEWFAIKYPDELEKAWFGHRLTRQISAGPLGSDKWLEVSSRMMKDLVKHFESIPEGKHIYAYLAGGGQSSEWYWPASVYGGIPGYSEGTRKSFRRWVKAKYGTEAALRKAWGDSQITFDKVEVPSLEYRAAAELGVFRDPVKGACFMDFRRYMTDQTNLHIKTLTSAITEASGGKKFAVVYSGYDFGISAGKLFKSGLCGNWEVMQMPSVDMITTPICYGSMRLGGSTGLRVNAMDSSAKMAGKILWQEDDPRTHLCLYADGNRTKDLAETLTCMDRSASQAIARGSACWWLLFDNSWFQQNEIIVRLKKNADLTRAMMARDTRSTAQAAFIFDEQSQFYLADVRSSFLSLHTWFAHENAVRSGAMFDYYYQRDFLKPEMPKYKLYIFISSYAADAATRQKIHAKLAKDGATAVWCYAPGYFDGRNASVENMKKMTGFNFRMVRGSRPITAPSKRVPGFGILPAQTVTADPQFYVTDPALVSTDKGGVFAAKKMNGWQSVFSLFPLTKNHIRALCRNAGIHIYLDSDDELFANRSCIMIHTRTAGDKTIRLPGKFTVTELYSGKVIGKNISRFTEKNVPAAATRLYRLD